MFGVLERYGLGLGFRLGIPLVLWARCRISSNSEGRRPSFFGRVSLAKNDILQNPECLSISLYLLAGALLHIQTCHTPSKSEVPSPEHLKFRNATSCSDRLASGYVSVFPSPSSCLFSCRLYAYLSTYLSVYLPAFIFYSYHMCIYTFAFMHAWMDR